MSRKVFYDKCQPKLFKLESIRIICHVCDNGRTHNTYILFIVFYAFGIFYI